MSKKRGEVGYRFTRDNIEIEIVDGTGTTTPVYRKYKGRHPYVKHMDPDGVYVVDCAMCGKNPRRADDNMPYLSGKWYHGESCYGKLFKPCSECNRKWIEESLEDGMCSPCYMKKHGLTAVWLRF